MYGATTTFAYFELLFLKIPTVKNFSFGGLLPPLRGGGGGGGRISFMHAKIVYGLVIAILNKYFEFQNDWLKIFCFKYNCTQFCPIPMC